VRRWGAALTLLAVCVAAPSVAAQEAERDSAAFFFNKGRDYGTDAYAGPLAGITVNTWRSPGAAKTRTGIST
jgi:hypothetical protein